MPRTKKSKIAEPKKFFIEGKDEITDKNAPVIRNEFIDTTREEGVYRGQEIEVKSETKLEQDQGTGEAFVLRTYEFITNPEMLTKGLPDSQAIFNSHAKGIEGMLWGDGLVPAPEIAPRLVFSKNGSKYLIMVWARPQLGETLVDQTRTLSEIVHERRPDRDKV